MNNIKYVFDKVDVKEFCLTMTGNYIPSMQRIELEQKENNNIILNIFSEDENYIEQFFGRIIFDKIYFARHQMTYKNPYIDYYKEFFSNGMELKF